MVPTRSSQVRNHHSPDRRSISALSASGVCWPKCPFFTADTDEYRAAKCLPRAGATYNKQDSPPSLRPCCPASRPPAWPLLSQLRSSPPWPPLLKATHVSPQWQSCVVWKDSELIKKTSPWWPFGLWTGFPDSLERAYYIIKHLEKQFFSCHIPILKKKEEKATIWKQPKWLH